METQTREITRGDWQRFFDDFSKQHQGETASVEVIASAAGVQPVAENLPFVGISADEAGSEKNSIDLILGTEPDDHLEHRISDPTHLWLKTDGDKVNDVIEIEAEDGTKTLLQLQPRRMLK